MHQYILTKEAIKVLKQQKSVVELMNLFNCINSRTIAKYIKEENHPSGKLLNVNVRQIIIANSGLTDESEIYKRYE